MSKKNLKDKIRQVGFWTFSGVFWYLVISFFLLSDYPIQDQPFNGEDAYMAIKDALGLAAAFLAPVAAFVLFQDWREQHTTTSNEKLSHEIIHDLKLIKKNFNFLTARKEQDFIVRRSEIFTILDKIIVANAKIYLINEEAKKFNKDIFDMRIKIVDLVVLENLIGREFAKKSLSTNDLDDQKLQLKIEFEGSVEKLKPLYLDLQS